MIPVAHLAHESSGRTRLKIPTERGNVDYFNRIGHDLAECPGIVRIEVNSRTGSLLILHTEPIARIASFARDHQLFILQGNSESHHTLLNQATKNLVELDTAISRFSLGDLDVRSLAFVILLLVSALQIFRGQILAPASTLLWYALELLLNARVPKEE